MSRAYARWESSSLNALPLKKKTPFPPTRLLVPEAVCPALRQLLAGPDGTQVNEMVMISMIKEGCQRSGFSEAQVFSRTSEEYMDDTKGISFRLLLMLRLRYVLGMIFL